MTNAAQRFVVIENDPDCPADRFEGWLGSGAVRVVRPYAGERVPASAHGGLIVLGGHMSANDDSTAPWLPEVRSLLEGSVADRVPTLGICLGAQLLALACGGVVERAAEPGRESGVIDVGWQPAAADDPVVAGLPNPTPFLSMHSDAIQKLPDGCTWLASSAMYSHQAFRVGTSAWGVQFHPEASLSTVVSWAERYRDVDTDSVVCQFAARQAELERAGRQIAKRFRSLVRKTGRAIV